MAKGGPKRLRAYFPGDLARAAGRQADETVRLRAAWQARVPDPLGGHTHPVRYLDGVLYIHVDTSAWLSRLRQQQTALVAGLRRDPLLRDLKELRMRVVPRESPRSVAPKRSASRLSPSAAAQIERSAEGIANPELREALKRLAQRTDGTPSKRRS